MPSAVIRSFHYDSDRRELGVVFQSGRKYLYEDVPEDTVRALKSSFSKGEFFNREIRDRYRFRRDDSSDRSPRSSADAS